MKRKPWRLALSACLLLLASAPGASAAQFEDVPDTYWAAPDIALCMERGFFTGETETTFAPLSAMERGDFVQVLSRFFGWEPGDVSSLPYKDVQPDDGYASSLAAAYREGAVTSQSEVFRAGDPITREELAVTLVRAMGYQSIAGLAEPVPFEDVITNSGYLGMAHNLGLMNGSNGLFMPSNSATRAQTAAVMSRLYRKLNAPPQRRVAVLESQTDMENLPGVQIAAVQTVRLASGTGMNLLLSREAASVLRDTARSTGAEAFLCAGGETVYRESVSLLLEEAASWDGLYLNLTGAADVEYVRQLKEGLGGKSLYLRIPASSDDSAIPYEALAEAADVLVVSVPGEFRMAVESSFPVSPVQPLENVYSTLCDLTRRVSAGKLCLELAGTGRLWTDGQYTGPVSGQEVEKLLNEAGARAYYSDRYASAYLLIPGSRAVGERVVWYPDGRGTSACVRLARLFGVEAVCLTGLTGISGDVWAALG